MSAFTKLTTWLQGRTTAFIIFFTITGTTFQFFHRLDSTFISFVTVIMGFVLGHSVKEDYFKSGASRQ